MKTLIESVKKVDHFDMIDGLARELNSAAESIWDIHSSLDMKTVQESRLELARELTTAQVYIELAKVKLSIMEGEWDRWTEEAIEIIGKDYIVEEKVEESFDTMEF